MTTLTTRRELLGLPSHAIKSAPATGTVVVVFQRFAADWINLLVPAGDPDYARLRSNVRIDDPLPLDGFFGLHPALAPLLPLYQSGSLGFVTATGWVPEALRDRSHFQAQQLAEAGGATGVDGGWLGRGMNALGPQAKLWAGLAAESSAPVSLEGYNGTIALQDFSSYDHGSVAGVEATALIESLAEVAGPRGQALRSLAASMQAIQADPPASSAVVYPNTNLGRGLRTAAEAIRHGLAPQVITVTSDDDWDTHVNQLSRHEASLPNVASALRSFHDDLGEQMADVTLVTLTEFGRKAIENFSGTDHGTAFSMLLMGGRVNGGQVLGQWPGLAQAQLFQNEDLMPTTDFRSVLGEVWGRHCQADDATLERVLPGGYATRANWVGCLT
ncbi:MAG: DUF1501 domain-containing protein [Pseudomonadota bacterium]|nr:DUF1501 domain-containing protein [Pseudomonadota bacterium]